MGGWLLLPAALIAADAGFTGSGACGACHAARLRQQAATGHARALRPAAQDACAALLAAAPAPGERIPSYEFLRTPGGCAVRIRTAQESRTIPLQWAFGAGQQAVTFVSQLDEDSYLEHRFSDYSAAKALDLTPGHGAAAPPALPDAAGVVYRTFDPQAQMMRCFQCHSTGRLALGPKMEIVPAEPGVRCEACHGPGRAHVDAITARDARAGRAAIRNPGRMSAAELNQLCGECHRQPASGEAVPNWNDPWNTRHQPVYLAESACFRFSRGALSCITCHDPHAPLRANDAAHYNGKCAACHAAKSHPKLSSGAPPDDCVRCHMPAVAPRPYLRFANHWIGVYREGAPLKPIRRR